MNNKNPNVMACSVTEEAANIEHRAMTTTVGIPSASNGQFKILTFVLICAAGVGFFYSKGNPQSADAAETDAPAAHLNANESPLDDASRAKQVRETLQLTEDMIGEFHTLSRKTHVPLTDLKLNPFRLGVELAGFVEPHDDSTLRQRREQERQAVLAAVQSLSLKSVMCGKSGRACMINNALFQEGQEVDGFRIETISPDAVVVCKGAYRFEIRAGK